LNHSRNIYSALGDASAAYTEFGRMDSISWIEHHELVRLRLSQLLYPLQKGKYKMSEAQ
jgi:hypothetical protein